MDNMSYNVYGQISALDFLHFTLLEYQRLQLKAYHDEEIIHRQRERKLAEITVPAIDDMFYRDPAIIIRNFDYGNAFFLPPSNYHTQQTGGSGIDIDEGLLRLAVPVSRFQNNPPKSRDEKRQERKRLEHEKDNNEMAGYSPQSKKVVPKRKIKNAGPIQIEDIELNDRAEPSAIKGSLKPKIISKQNKVNNTESTIFKDNQLPFRSKELESKLENLDSIRVSPNIKIDDFQTNQSPSKFSSRANLGISPSTQKLLGVGAHTSSVRSLYGYGSRGQNTPHKEENKETDAAPEPESDTDSHKEDFSSMLYNVHKPSFITRSGKKTSNEDKEVASYYKGNTNRSRSPPPDLPPRDFTELNDRQIKQSLDLEQSEEKSHFGNEYSKFLNSSRSPSKSDAENNEKSRREGDREKRISVLDDVEDF
jgi:hypothetical protein